MLKWTLSAKPRNTVVITQIYFNKKKENLLKQEVDCSGSAVVEFKCTFSNLHSI